MTAQAQLVYDAGRVEARPAVEYGRVRDHIHASGRHGMFVHQQVLDITGHRYKRVRALLGGRVQRQVKFLAQETHVETVHRHSHCGHRAHAGLCRRQGTVEIGPGALAVRYVYAVLGHQLLQPPDIAQVQAAREVQRKEAAVVLDLVVEAALRPGRAVQPELFLGQAAQQQREGLLPAAVARVLYDEKQFYSALHSVSPDSRSAGGQP